jgi:hypothetical protein
MADAAGVRQDKVKYFVADLEAAVGTFEYVSELTGGSPTPTGSELRIPARGSSRLAAVDGEMIDNSEALDGGAGAIASTRGAIGMGGTIVTEVHADGVTIVYPWHVKQLLASGFEATYSDPELTLVPSTKALTNWPGETGGARSPASCSVVEARIDNNTADEWTGAMGAVFATKINLATNSMVTYESTITGQIANDVLTNVLPVDLSGFGGIPANQGAVPATVKNATLVVKYTDDDVTDQTITPDRFRNLEIDLAPNIVRVEDPTATNGFAVSPVFYDGAIGVTLQFADSSDYDNSVTGGTIMAGFKSGRGFLSIELTLTLDDQFTVDQTLKFDMPRIQYDVARENAEGARAFTFTGMAVREKRGSTTSPITITYSHGTA